MAIFTNEKTNISSIISVRKYEMSESFAKNNKTVKYSANLKTYELIFYVSSSSETHFCGVDILDKENSIRYLPKGNFNGKYTVRGLKAGYCIDVYFDTDAEMPLYPIGLYDYAILRDKFIKLYNIWSNKKSNYYARAMSVFYEIIAVLQDVNRYSTNTQRLKLAPAFEYISQNYKAFDFDYNALCKVCNLSYSYFITLFKAVSNMTPIQYVTKMKIDYSKELLITEKYSITQIAEMCGFDNVYYFSNVFKKHIGVSPTAYINTL